MAAPRANLVDDLTTTAGLILCFGLLAFIPGNGGLMNSIRDDDVDWNGSDTEFPPIVSLLGDITVTLFGMSSVFIGFQYLACRWGSKTSSLFGLAITLAAWFPFLVNIARISFLAHKEIVGGPPLVVAFPASKNDVSLPAVPRRVVLNSSQIVPTPTCRRRLCAVRLGFACCAGLLQLQSRSFFVLSFFF